GAATTHAGLNTLIEAVARWLAVAHLVIPRSAGGQVLLVGDTATAAAQALVRFDPVVLAERELAERVELGFPPATRVAELVGDGAAVSAVLAHVPLATPENVVGPLPFLGTTMNPIPVSDNPVLFEEPQVRVLARVPAAQGLELAAQLRAALAVRSAKREPGRLRARLDPAELAAHT
ncbi:MAG: primosomal protein N', partial [Promicromonosporaceae bacterium]|nr:primosomal protein N' [Promicromonosporaceae bacterium]